MSKTEEEEKSQSYKADITELSEIITLYMCFGLVKRFRWQTRKFFNLLLSPLLLCPTMCVVCRRWEKTHTDRMCDCGHGWDHSSSVCMWERKTQIIAHEMLFIQSRSSVTIPDYSTQQLIGETQQNKSQRKYPSVNFTRESLTSLLIFTPHHDSCS